MTTAAPLHRLDPHTLAEDLLEARARTLLLVAPLTDEELRAQHDPLMSPILWDLGHIAHFEELWLTRNLDGPIEFVEMPGMYNPFEHPRSKRGALPLPGLAEVYRAAEEHDRLVPVIGETARFWRDRARGTEAHLRRLLSSDFRAA